jgi:hypothetical protein
MPLRSYLSATSILPKDGPGLGHIGQNSVVQTVEIDLPELATTNMRWSFALRSRWI